MSQYFDGVLALGLRTLRCASAGIFSLTSDCNCCQTIVPLF